MSVYYDPDFYIAKQERTVIAGVNVLTLDSVLKTQTKDNPQIKAELEKKEPSEKSKFKLYRVANSRTDYYVRDNSLSLYNKDHRKEENDI